jgi:hypothetical protein
MKTGLALWSALPRRAARQARRARCRVCAAVRHGPRPGVCARRQHRQSVPPHPSPRPRAYPLQELRRPRAGKLCAATAAQWPCVTCCPVACPSPYCVLSKPAKPWRRSPIRHAPLDAKQRRATRDWSSRRICALPPAAMGTLPRSSPSRASPSPSEHTTASASTPAPSPAPSPPPLPTRLLEQKHRAA